MFGNLYVLCTFDRDEDELYPSSEEDNRSEIDNIRIAPYQTDDDDDDEKKSNDDDDE